jgi:hypothetical protein
MGWEERLELRPLLTVSGRFQDVAYDVGMTAFGWRRVYLVEEGRFHFEVESGVVGSGLVVPGSGDWSLRSTDNRTISLDVRALLEVRDPENLYIHIRYEGTAVFDNAMLERIQLAGDTIRYVESRFLTQPRFQTGRRIDMRGRVLRPSSFEQKIDRLNTAACVGHVELSYNRLDQHIYEVINPAAPPV